MTIRLLIGAAAALAVAWFAGPAWPIYLTGAVVGATVAFVVRDRELEPEIDSYWLARWVRGAHRSHGGTSDDYRGTGAFPLAGCTEPECEEGAIALERAFEKERGR